MEEDSLAEGVRSSVPETNSGSMEISRQAMLRNMEEAETTHYMTPAVNYLSYEPNFLFKEFASD